MTNWLLTGAWLMPLAVIPLVFWGRSRWWPTVGAVPALLGTLLIPDGARLSLEWFLMGAEIGLIGSDRFFLGTAAVLYLTAGAFAAIYTHGDPRRTRFEVLWLLTMSGNFALIVGQDPMSFYMGFTLMSLAAYGLVIHDGSAEAIRAGRVYLIMTLIAEFVLFVGFVAMASPTGNWVVAGVRLEFLCLLLAFGIKAGLCGLHMWLPLAHPAAPVPASAVLSGVMIKTALIGWLRYLPVGEESLPLLGGTLLWLGLAGIVLGLIAGVVQRDAKTVLAYSSISKMGLMVSLLGVALAFPDLAPALVPAIAFFAAHHGLAKGALFLGIGVIRRVDSNWYWALLVPMGAMLGLPFSSGALGKELLKTAAALDSGVWSAVVQWSFGIATVGSVMLMGRFFVLVRGQLAPEKPGWNPVVLPWLALVLTSLALGALSPTAGSPLDYLLMAGTALVCVFAAGAAWPRFWIGRIPPGDLLEIVSPALTAFTEYWAAGALFTRRLLIQLTRPVPGRPLGPVWSDRLESFLLRGTTRGALWLAILLGLIFIMFHAGSSERPFLAVS